MAVVKACRGSGIGGAILHALVEEARRRNMAEVTLGAQIHAIGFYARYGFEAVGDEFMDAGIPHRKMILSLRA